uniref:two-CW domain-containing protein n=1 Tax=Candidatus Electronema sp. TaxID=2698783 RepID=UPI0040572A38
MKKQKNKLNCWEFKECGREPGGRNAALFGICPAVIVHQADGIHDGKNGGRCCWFMTASLATEKQEEHYVKKSGNCRSCDFYNLVRKQEHTSFILRYISPSQIRPVQS